jgi:hypothetical protein
LLWTDELLTLLNSLDQGNIIVAKSLFVVSAPFTYQFKDKVAKQSLELNNNGSSQYIYTQYTAQALGSLANQSRVASHNDYSLAVLILKAALSNQFASSQAAAVANYAMQ